MTGVRGRPALPDTVVALWCALWLVVGAWTAYEMWQLSGLSDTVADTGRTLDSAGEALQSLGGVPVVGDRTEQLGNEVRANAAQVVDSAGDAGQAVRRLSVLLGLTIALVPSGAVLLLRHVVRRGAVHAVSEH